jgi:hypothetical protein
MKIGTFHINMKGKFHVTGKNTFESKLKEYKISKGCLYSRFKGKTSKWKKLKTLVIKQKRLVKHNARTDNPYEAEEVADGLEDLYDATAEISEDEANEFLIDVIDVLDDNQTFEHLYTLARQAFGGKKKLRDQAFDWVNAFEIMYERGGNFDDDDEDVVMLVDDDGDDDDDNDVIFNYH